MNAPTPDDDLSGVPGLGPVRRRLLAASGITSRAALARATPEQIVAVTGMPRGAAEQVAEFVGRATAPDSALTPGPSPSEERPSSARRGEEERGDGVGETGEPAPPDLSGLTASGAGDDAPATTRLERAALRAQTAIADASRRAEPGSKLGEMLVRFARLTDELPRRVTPETRGGVLRRITARVEAIAERLEAVGSAKKKEAGPLGSKRAKRLQQRLKRTRDSIRRTLKGDAAR